jgi:hypothetical protein
LNIKKIKLHSRIIAILFLLAMIVNWSVAYLFQIPIFGQPSWSGEMFFIALLFFAFNVLSVVGLVKVCNWGFIVSYIAILYSTIFIGITYIPFYQMISNAFGVYLWQPAILGNIVLIIWLIMLQMNFVQHLEK